MRSVPRGLLANCMIGGSSAFGRLKPTKEPKESNGYKHLRVPDHGTTNGGVFDDVVLLHDRQNVTTKLSHLTIILLDHFDSARDIQRSSRLFENRYLWHGSRHRYDLLTTIVSDQKASGRSHLSSVLRNLTQFKAGDSSVDSHIAYTVEDFTTFT
jgi:hypothetical protein